MVTLRRRAICLPRLSPGSARGCGPPRRYCSVSRRRQGCSVGVLPRHARHTTTGQHGQRSDRRQLAGGRIALAIRHEPRDLVGQQCTGRPANGTISSTRRVPRWRRPATLGAAWLCGRSSSRCGCPSQIFCPDAVFGRAFRFR